MKIIKTCVTFIVRPIYFRASSSPKRGVEEPRVQDPVRPLSYLRIWPEGWVLAEIDLSRPAPMHLAFSCGNPFSAS